MLGGGVLVFFMGLKKKLNTYPQNRCLEFSWNLEVYSL